MVVDAEVNKEQGRPLFGVDGGVCSKKYLTGADIVRDVRFADESGVDSLLEQT